MPECLFSQSNLAILLSLFIYLFLCVKDEDSTFNLLLLFLKPFVALFSDWAQAHSCFVMVLR